MTAINMIKENEFLFILDKYGNRHIREGPLSMDDLVLGEDSPHYQSLYKSSKDLKYIEDINEELSIYFINEYLDNPHISEIPSFIEDSDAWINR